MKDENNSKMSHEQILEGLKCNKEKLDLLIEKISCVDCDCGCDTENTYSEEKHKKIFEMLEENNKMLTGINEWILEKHPKV